MDSPFYLSRHATVVDASYRSPSSESPHPLEYLNIDYNTLLSFGFALSSLILAFENTVRLKEGRKFSFADDMHNCIKRSPSSIRRV